MDSRRPAALLRRSPAIPAVLILAMVQCSLCGPLSDLSSVFGPREGTRVEASAGGTVSDGGGALVAIPPGALAEDMRVSVHSYVNLGSVAEYWGMTPGFVAGAEFGPDGLTFEAPVTVTLPLLDALTPGASYPLFAYDAESQQWTETEFVAMVSPDGGSLQAEVMHFSLYGVFDLPEMAVMEDFQRFLRTEGDPEAAFYAYVDWYVGSLRVLEMRILFEGCCYAITGVGFVFTYDLGGTSNTLDQLVGEMSSVSQGFKYDEEVAEGGQQQAMSLSIEWYLGCRPDLLVQAEEAMLMPGETTAVRASLSCGGQPMANRQIGLSTSGPGTVNPAAVQTSSDGGAVTTFTAGEESGEARVTGEYRTCTCEESLSDLQGTVIQTALIDVEEGDRWAGNYTVPLFTGLAVTGTISIDFTFTVLDQTWAEYDPDAQLVGAEVGGEVFAGSLAEAEGDAVVGSGTASQALQFTNPGPGGCCFDAPSTLDVQVIGIRTDLNQVWLSFVGDHFYEMQTACCGLISFNAMGISEPIPLEEGSYQGSMPEGIGSYQITLERP